MTYARRSQLLRACALSDKSSAQGTTSRWINMRKMNCDRAVVLNYERQQSDTVRRQLKNVFCQRPEDTATKVMDATTIDFSLLLDKSKRILLTPRRF